MFSNTVAQMDTFIIVEDRFLRTIDDLLLFAKVVLFIAGDATALDIEVPDYEIHQAKVSNRRLMQSVRRN
ncbi:MAG: hypothetical protein ACI9J0_001205 [Cryomorphaceae bacterium]